MKILIVAATFLEIKPLLIRLKYKNKKDFLFESFSFKKNEIDVLVTGLGMMHTAFCLGEHFVEREDYDLAVNLGICGSFSKKLKLGEAVNVVEDRVGDLGAEDGESFLDVFDMKLIKGNTFPYKNGVLKASVKNFNRLPYKKVNAITVNTVHGNEKSIQKVIKKYTPQVESMEGAAFFFACCSAMIPCLQLRAVSNYVEKRNKKNWKIKLAINNLNRAAMKIISEL